MAADPSRSQRAPTAKRTRMTPEARRAQIVESARQVFIESGLSKSRIRDIADKAGVTQALIYYHFKTKAEIYQAAVRDPLDAMVDRLVDETQALASREGADTRSTHRRRRGPRPTAVLPSRARRRSTEPAAGLPPS